MDDAHEIFSIHPIRICHSVIIALHDPDLTEQAIGDTRTMDDAADKEMRTEDANVAGADAIISNRVVREYNIARADGGQHGSAADNEKERLGRMRAKREQTEDGEPQQENNDQGQTFPSGRMHGDQ